MKVLTLLGTRPEIIRLSEVIRRLDDSCEHVLVHTGQNHDPRLSDYFFQELRVRTPDHYLEVQAADFALQVARIFERVGSLLRDVQPERMLILGDTNSGLASIVAARLRIPVFHMEAGNRCYDGRVPEEINRRLIDHSSSVLLPYTRRSAGNLRAEGISAARIIVTGNPIFEVLQAHACDAERSAVLERLGLEAGRYLLATLHRAETVDSPTRLASLVRGLEAAAELVGLPVVVSVHPRTASRLAATGIAQNSPLVRLSDPFGFFDFIKLQRNALCVLTDSGTVQEETCIMRVPSVTIRESTERPETIDCGSTVLAGTEPAQIVSCFERSLSAGTDWVTPPEYLVPNVSEVITKIVLEHPLPADG